MKRDTIRKDSVKVIKTVNLCETLYFISQPIECGQEKSSLNRKNVGFVWVHVPNSVQFSFSVVSESLRPHGLQHTRFPCPSPTPWACSNSCPLSCWCYPTISSSVVPFSSCLQSFSASRSFPMSQFFTSDSQSIGASASASVLSMNI